MPGLYIHIPFCRRRCSYCDFFSTTQNGLQTVYVEALIREIRERRDFLSENRLDTIYFGGGTPSQLPAIAFAEIFDTIRENFSIAENAEITLEANPDDLKSDYLAQLESLPFNRISLGIQSFDDEDLIRLNRRHLAEQAIEAVHNCRKHGFTNLSIDLMYGLPFQTATKWEKNLDIALSLLPPHISAYHLTYEEGTALFRQLQKGEVSPVDEEFSVSFFETLKHKLENAGYLHYEISNFAREGYLSRHNSSYWKGTPYLGIGASAHSFDGSSRIRNVSSLTDYLKGNRIAEYESLDEKTRYNDYIVTRLRTMWGIDLNEIEKLYGSSYSTYCLQLCHPYLDRELLVRDENAIRLTGKGIFLSDGIIADLLKI